MNMPLNMTLPGFAVTGPFSVARLEGRTVSAVFCPDPLFMSMPLSAFVLSSAHPQFSARRESRRFERYEYHAPRGIDALFVSNDRSGSSSIIGVGHDKSAASPIHPIQMQSYFALLAAAQHEFPSIGIASPFWTGEIAGDPDEQILKYMLSGALSMLQSDLYPKLESLVIQCRSPEMVNLFGEFAAAYNSGFRATDIEAAHQEVESMYAARLEAYLKGRMASDPIEPKSVFHHGVFYENSYVASHDAAYVQTSPTDPEPGFVRLMTNELLERAAADVPSFIIDTDLASSPPAYLYSRCRTNFQKAHNGAMVLSSCRNAAFTITLKNGRTFIMTEVSLMDLPYELLNNVNRFAHILMFNYMPKVMLHDALESFSEGAVPDRIQQMIDAGIQDDQRYSFDEADFDKILSMQARHEFAEGFWYSIPKEMKRMWMQIYSMEKDRPGDIYFYRNLLRVFVEREASESSEDFFARETFADKLAMFWSSDLPEILKSEGTAIRPEERIFFSRLMDDAREKRKKYGSVFAVID